MDHDDQDEEETEASGILVTILFFGTPEDGWMTFMPNTLIILKS